MQDDLPTDLESFIERLQTEVAELRAARDAAADRLEMDLFDRLADGLDRLADNLELLLSQGKYRN